MWARNLYRLHDTDRQQPPPLYEMETSAEVAKVVLQETYRNVQETYSVRANLSQRPSFSILGTMSYESI